MFGKTEYEFVHLTLLPFALVADIFLKHKQNHENFIIFQHTTFIYLPIFVLFFYHLFERYKF